MKISDIMSMHSIALSVKAKNKRLLLQELSQIAANVTKVDERTIFDALLERENLGSTGFGGNGLPVLVAQNLQPLVHTSPKIINVAVRLLQHSALFGHLPLLQIVWRECSRTIRATSAKVSLLWSLIFSHSGFLAGAFSPYNFGIFLSSLFPIGAKIQINSKFIVQNAELFFISPSSTHKKGCLTA